MPYFKPKVYIKDQPYDPIYTQINFWFMARTRIVPIAVPVLALTLLATQVALPLVTFQTQEKNTEILEVSALGYVSGFQEFKFDELSVQKEQNQQNHEKSQVLGKSTFNSDDSNYEEYFYLTIPKLNIKRASVQINEPTLVPDHALGHYTGSALPGEPGNSFIYGHSVLPFFYNPKNYKTIFSTLGDLETGDEFTIEYKGKTLTYKVEGKRQLKPDQVNPLAEIKPKYLNESTVVLMTCSPPGTKLYRLLIDAVLVTG